MSLGKHRLTLVTIAFALIALGTGAAFSTSSGPDLITRIGSFLGIEAARPASPFRPEARLLAPQAATVAGWDFSALPGGTGNYGTSPLAASTADTSVTVGGLTRGSGFGQSGSGASAAWGGSSTSTTTTESGAITASQFFTFTVTPKAGFSLSLSDIAAYNIRRSGSGPANYIWQYQVGAGAFTDIGSSINPTGTTSSGNAEPAVDLTGISALQNIPASTTVTFRIVAWNSSTVGGTFYLKDLGNSTTNDLIVDGTVAAATTSTTTSLSANPGTTTNSGQNVTFTATVTQVPSGPVTTGTVSFYDNNACSGTQIGSTTALNASGQAQVTTNSLSVGDHTIKACYSGNSSFAASNGSLTQHVVGSGPTVTSISPTSGPPAGGTTVTINGANFTGVTAVNFGGTAATPVNFVSDSQITVPSPAGSGTVHVTVTTPAGTSAASASDQFTYAVPPPTTQASNLQVTGSTQNSVSLSWTNGDGASRIVLAKAVAVDGVPVDGTTYTANTTFGSGTVVGTGNYTVFNGTGSSVTVTGLAGGTTYGFAVFEYNGSAGSEVYLTTSPATTTQQTPTATYTWSGGSAAFGTAANWTPARSIPATSDILQFNDGTAPTVTGVSTQTIGKLLVSNSTQVTLQASASGQTLTIGGGSGAFQVGTQQGSTSQLNISGTNSLKIALTGATTTGSVYGSMTLAGTGHTLTAAVASGVTFQNGSSFTYNVSGTNPFGSSGTAGSIHFANGSTYILLAGNNPFGPAGAGALVVFETGSLYSSRNISTAPVTVGRTYSNFEYDAVSGSIQLSGSSAPVIFDDFHVKNGTVHESMTGGGTYIVNGNLTVDAGGTLDFNPGSAGTFTLSGSSPQTITNNGTITYNSNISASIPNGSTVIVGSGASLPATTLNGTLKGTGTTGALTVGATGVVSPGNSPGLLTTGNVTMASGSALNMELGGTTAGTGYDQLKVNGAVDLSASPTINLSTVNAFAIAGGQSFILIDNDGSDAINGTFANLPNGLINNFLGSGLTATVNYAGGDGNDLQITVNLPTFTITPSAGTGGTITPSTAQTVNQGADSPVFTIAPATGYDIADVTLDSTTHLGPVTSYQFTNVQGNHTIDATFAIKQFTITATAGANGSIAPNGATQHDYNSSQTYSITPDSLYNVQDVTVDGGSVGAVTSYTFNNITAAHTINATFALATVNTATTIASSQNPSFTDQSVTYTATVKTTPGNVAVATGTLTIYANNACSGTQLASATPNASGQVAATVNSQTAGTRSIIACYTAGTGFANSTSSVLTQTVNKHDQTINFTQPTDTTFDLGPKSLFATADSNLAVSFFSLTPLVCSVPDANVGSANFVAVGQCTIRASQGGNADYNAAPDVDKSFQIAKGNQTINFAALGTKTFGDADFGVSATATSSLAVSFATSGACTNTGSTIHLLSGAGTCTVTASQAGDPNWNAAADVPRAFTVNRATPTLTINAGQTSFTYNGSPQGPTAYTLTGVTGGPAPVDDTAFTYVGVTPTVFGPGSTKPSDAGTYSAHATKGTDANYNSVTSADVAFAIAKSNASITFGGATTATYPGADFTVTASTTNTDSGAVTFSKVSGPCTQTSGGTFSPTGAGNCVIQADGSATTNFNAATNQQTVAISLAQYSLNYAAGAHGSLTGNTSQTVNYGGNGTAVTAVPDPHYHFTGWSDATNANPRTDTNVSGNISVTANFAIDTYTITVTQSANGTIAPGTSTVNYGGSQTFTITPDAGFQIATLTVDGSTVTPAASYTFSNVSANHTITATYTSSAAISTPDTSALFNHSVTIPVNTSDLTGANVISAQFTFSFDRTVMSGNPADISVTPGAVLPVDGSNQQLSTITYNVVDDPDTVNNPNVTHVYVSIFGAYPFVGAGSLVDIHTKAIGHHPATSPETISDFLYNGGRLTTGVTSGTFSITKLSQTIAVDTPAPATAEYLSQFSVAAHSTSGLPVAITTSGSCSGSGANGSATITMTAATGACTVHYNQSGDVDTYFAATEVTSDTTADRATTSTVLAFEAGPYVYRGTPFTATASVSGPGPFSQSLTPGYSGDCTNVTSASGCSASASFLGNSNYKPSSDSKSITITKATSQTVIDCSPGSFVYTGSAITQCTATVTSANLNTTVPVSYGSNTNVGTATADASYSGDTNHTGSTATQVTFQITAATAACTITGFSGTYDSLQHGATGQCTGVGGPTDVLTGVTIAPTTYRNVPGGLVHWTFANPNYTSQSGDATVAIGSRAATWTTNAASKAFGDSDPSPLTTGGGTNFIAGDGVSATYSRVAGEAASPPTYHITATLNATVPADLNNYTITNDGAEFAIDSRNLSGQVLYKNAATPPVGIPEVTVSATGSPAVTSSLTDADGKYSLTGFGSTAYDVTLSKPNLSCNHPNGISVFDASMISQHVVHLITLTPTQLESANVSGNPTVTSFDASLIAQYLVCLNNPVSVAGHWTFDSYSSTVGLNDDHNFLCILKGDVSGNWDPTGAQSKPQLAASALGMDATRASLAEVQTMQGSQVTVPMRLDNLKGEGVVAYEFDVEYDPTILTAGQGAASLQGTLSNGLAVVSNSPQPGLLKVVVYGALPVSGDGVYVKLTFSAIGQSGSVSPLAIKQFTLNDGKTQVLTQNGSVSINAATGPMFTGRVLTSTGSPIRNARVAFTTTTGRTVSVLSNSFGYVTISGITPGETYTLTTVAKGYAFTPVSLTASAGLTQIEIVAHP